jgi:8-oxo-dGTP diphosphatase
MPIKQVFQAYEGMGETDPRHFKYCPRCGTSLIFQERGGRHRPGCPQCGFVQYRNPLPGVVVVIEQDGQVLLGKRAGGFGQGKWGLPQGFIEFEEDFLTAARREVREETNLAVEIRSILNVVSNQLSPQLHTLVVIVLARVTGGVAHPGDDLEALVWFPLKGPLPNMAFEADTAVIRRYRESKFDDGLPVDPAFSGKA